MVKLRPDETLESLIRRFKKDVDKSGVMKELHKREYYKKPSVKKKLKHEEALKLARKFNKG